MQMGVEVVAIAEPVTAETRRTLRKLEHVEPIAAKWKAPARCSRSRTTPMRRCTR